MVGESDVLVESLIGLASFATKSRRIFTKAGHAVRVGEHFWQELDG